MAFEKNTSAGYLVNLLARRFARALQAEIAGIGLTPGTFPALLELWEKDGLTQKNLVERLDIEQATMANTLARMERDGLIRRRKDDNDARVQRIYLTDAAKALRDPATQAAERVNATALRGLADGEAQVFLGLMHKVLTALATEQQAGTGEASGASPR